MASGTAGSASKEFRAGAWRRAMPGWAHCRLNRPVHRGQGRPRSTSMVFSCSRSPFTSIDAVFVASHCSSWSSSTGRETPGTFTCASNTRTFSSPFAATHREPAGKLLVASACRRPPHSTERRSASSPHRRRRPFRSLFMRLLSQGSSSASEHRSLSLPSF